MDKKIYLTKEGLEELKKELEMLTKQKRPVVLDRLTQARNMGDLSENAEYTASREELAFIDGRIDEIAELLKQVVIITEHSTKGAGKKQTVELGSKVKLDHEKKQDVYTVVGEWEADPALKKISHESPLGKALLGKIKGESVEVKAPAGKVLYTILSVE